MNSFFLPVHKFNNDHFENVKIVLSCNEMKAHASSFLCMIQISLRLTSKSVQARRLSVFSHDFHSSLKWVVYLKTFKC
jgi:hypothetical protein